MRTAAASAVPAAGHGHAELPPAGSAGASLPDAPRPEKESRLGVSPLFCLQSLVVRNKWVPLVEMSRLVWFEIDGDHWLRFQG